jgi:hypothetical protein
MGHVQAFDLNSLIKNFNISGYIETGTGIGDSLSHALKFQEFKKIYSVEIDNNLFKNAVEKFQDPRLKIINDYSKNALPIILSELNENDNFLFFLDAHFPDADFGSAPDRYKVSSEKYGKDALPLEEELTIINSFRTNHKDLLIIDDVWIYEMGPFESGNWREKEKIKTGTMEFVEKIFGNYYDIHKFYKQQGYLLLTPQGTSCQ